MLLSLRSRLTGPRFRPPEIVGRRSRRCWWARPWKRQLSVPDSAFARPTGAAHPRCFGIGRRLIVPANAGGTAATTGGKNGEGFQAAIAELPVNRIRREAPPEIGTGCRGPPVRSRLSPAPPWLSRPAPPRPARRARAHRPSPTSPGRHSPPTSASTKPGRHPTGPATPRPDLHRGERSPGPCPPSPPLPRRPTPRRGSASTASTTAPLIQTGTEEDYYNGAAHYNAWWEFSQPPRPRCRRRTRSAPATA